MQCSPFIRQIENFSISASDQTYLGHLLYLAFSSGISVGLQTSSNITFQANQCNIRQTASTSLPSDSEHCLPMAGGEGQTVCCVTGPETSRSQSGKMFIFLHSIFCMNLISFKELQPTLATLPWPSAHSRAPPRQTSFSPDTQPHSHPLSKRER